MRLGLDVRLWNQTGVGRYIRNLVINLSQIDKKNNYFLFAMPDDFEQIEKMVSSNFKVIKTNIAWHGVKEQVEFPKILNSHKLDLMHFPYFSVPIFYNGKFVVTVHDMIVNKFKTGKASTLPYPWYLVKRLGYNLVFSTAVRKAQKIVVPSNAVCNQLVSEYRNIKEKIIITPEGGFEKEQGMESKKPFIDSPYFLRVGNFYPHKNVEMLIKAFGLLLKEPHNFTNNPKLVLVGRKDYFYNNIKSLVESLGIESSVIFEENISDKDLAALYSNARATVVPSLMEGFSLTCVEALSCGGVVIASDIPVHREVCGDTAMYCNASDINDIKQKLEEALSLSRDERKIISGKAIKQASKFSWEEMAKNTLQIYQQVCG